MGEAITVTGLVERSLELGYDGLAGLPGQVEDVSSEAPGREGRAVRFSSLLEAAGVGSGAAFVTLEAEGDFAASVPLGAVAGQALVVYGLGGGWLPEDRGGPVRFLVPDPASCGTAEVDTCSNVKGLRRIELSAGRGRDTRPSTLRAHMELHEHEREGGGRAGGEEGRA